MINTLLENVFIRIHINMFLLRNSYSVFQVPLMSWLTNLVWNLQVLFAGIPQAMQNNDYGLSFYFILAKRISAQNILG